VDGGTSEVWIVVGRFPFGGEDQESESVRNRARFKGVSNATPIKGISSIAEDGTGVEGVFLFDGVTISN
jgi:hypothetical protein